MNATEQTSPLRDQILDCARGLKLSALRSTLQPTLQTAIKEDWTHDRFLLSLLCSEREMRDQNRIKAYIRKAGFPQLKYLEDLKRQELPQDGAIVLPELETLDFIKEGQNVVLAGSPGAGKTHIAIGLGIKACQQGYNVLFTSVPHLLTQIRECQSQRRLRKFELQFEKYDLVICDEFGYISFNKDGAEALFNHISLRCGRKSTIITTNLTFDRWNEIFIDPILACAMVDRLTHRAYLVNMFGSSFRTKETVELMKNRSKNKNITKT
jgi:DNA replication protein DnaC